MEDIKTYFENCNSVEMLIALECIFEGLPEEEKILQFERCKRAINVFMALNPEVNDATEKADAIKRAIEQKKKNNN